MMPRRFVRLALIAICALAGQASAHELRPVFVTPTFTADGRYEIAIVANMEALIAGVTPEHAGGDERALAAIYDHLRALPAEDLRARIEAFLPRWLDGITIEFDGVRVEPRVTGIEVPPPGDLGLERLTTVRLAGAIPPGATTFGWRYAAEFGSSVLRTKRAGSDEIVAVWLQNGKPSQPVPLAGMMAKGTLALMADYVALGFRHIIPNGFDHILFVLGLTLLSPRLKPLLIQVTAFTVAHSITLALGLYGAIDVPPAIVEPLIAASIVYVAVENLVTADLHPWRPFVVFGFGLLHGLGFAGVLREIGLPRGDYLACLVGFNIGVELGQLAVIALAFAATGLWFRTRPWYRARIVRPASAAIALIGLFWTMQRVFFA
jgi:hypothetical protein